MSIGSSTTPATAQAESQLTRLGPWRLVQLVHSGPMTRIYRARPASIPADRPAAYAIKYLPERWQEDRTAIELLRREALLGRSVAHRHLVPVLAAHIAGPPYFLVMPWLDGRALSAHLARGTHWSVATVLWIARQAAEGLDALQAAGWMHGDVKPANIHLSSCGHTTLLDLAFARRLNDADAAHDACLLGTGHYMAPERFVSRMRSDVRSDIYSLGATLYEMLSGRRPIEGNTLADLAERHRSMQPPPLRRLAPHLPHELAELVHAMLAKEPLRRPQTPGEVIKRLAWLEIETFELR